MSSKTKVTRKKARQVRATKNAKQTQQKSSIHVLHGFSEGRATTRPLRDALSQTGFMIVNDPLKADVIVGHSAGSLIIPRKHRAQLVVFINPTYWPGRTIIEGGARKVWRDFVMYSQSGNLRRWLWETGRNTLYLWNITQNVRMLEGLRTRAWRDVRAPRLVLMRNRYDPFCRPDIISHLPRTAAMTFPGGHDDCWQNPAPYAQSIMAIWTAHIGTAKR